MSETTITYRDMLLARIAAHQARETEKADEAARNRAEIDKKNAAYLGGLQMQMLSSDASDP
jgi:hypothetical protein